MKIKLLFKKSLTMPELIIVLVILGVAIPAMVGVLGQVNKRAGFSEDIAKLSFYAESLMEETTLTPFSNLANSSGNYPFNYSISVANASLNGNSWALNAAGPYKMIMVNTSRHGRQISLNAIRSSVD